MAEIFPFQRPAKSRVRSRQRSILARWSYLPWQPLATLLLIAATFCAVQIVDQNTKQLSAQLNNASYQSPPAASPETPAEKRAVTVNVAMPLCKGWPRVNCVIDGDTIWYQGAKIRIADINAPETHDPHCAFEANLGKRATKRMIELLNAGSFAIVATGDRDEDVYGRKLRLIERNGYSLGNTLVAEGLAERWTGSRRNWCA